MTEPLDLLIDGPPPAAPARLTLALAHGAGAPMDSPFMAAFAAGLADRMSGLRVARFEFPYMAARRGEGRRRPPDRQPKLLAHWRAVIDALAPSPADRRRLAIGGKSMGGRMATLVGAELEAEAAPVAALLALGYPFHPPGKPDRLRVEHLAGLATPTLVCQGARDPFGTAEEVPGYGLSPAVRLHWLEDGDHGFKPRKASGRSEQENWDDAMDAVARFLEDAATRTAA